MEDDWKMGKPLIILNVIGDVNHDKSTKSHMKELLSGFIQRSKYACPEGETCWPWIITNPLFPIGKIVGNIVKDINESCNTVEDKICNIPVRCVGLCTWGLIADRDQIKRISGSDDVAFKVEKKLHYLNPYMSHYLFVDDGTEGIHGLDRYAEKLVSEYKEPRVSVIVGGGTKTLMLMNKYLKQSIPCILVSGTGGIADTFARVLSRIAKL